MDSQTKVEFEKLLSLSGNKTCIDCDSFNPQWASVSNGAFMCIKCAGIHRSLGVHVSFVRSVTMDSWSPIQLSRMKCGGNDALHDFWKDQKFPNNLSAQEKYDNEAMELYRAHLLSKAKGESPQSIPFIGYIPRAVTQSSTNINSDSNNQNSNSDKNDNNSNINNNDNNSNINDNDNDGNKRSFDNTGFGNYDPNENDIKDNQNQPPLEDILNDFSSWALTMAKKSSQAAVDIAEQSKKVASTLTSKATESAKTLSQKLQDENLQEKVSQTAAQGWTTVTSWLASAQKQVQTLAQLDDEPLRFYNRDDTETNDSNNNSNENNHILNAHLSSDTYFNQNSDNNTNANSFSETDANGNTVQQSLPPSSQDLQDDIENKKNNNNNTGNDKDILTDVQSKNKNDDNNQSKSSNAESGNNSIEDLDLNNKDNKKKKTITMTTLMIVVIKTMLIIIILKILK